ncbi:unnamed protein product [Calypogeia fissa]
MASMKLRVRAAGGGPTIRVQIPLLCSLQGLKDVLAPLVSLPASSFSLSLNKKDEIQGPGSALLSSFGVTSGDLLFYIVNSGGSFPNIQLTGNPSSRVVGSSNPSDSTTAARASVPSMYGPFPPPQTGSPNRGGRTLSNPATRRELCAAAAARRQAVSLATEQQQQQETTMVSSDSISLDEKTSVDSDSTASPGGISSVPSSNPPMAEAEQGPVMDMEIDARGPLEEMASSGGGGHRLVPIPDLLQRVLTTEFENVRQPCMFLVLAVHAVMLETGFVRIETGRSNTNSTAQERARTMDGYELPSGWSGAGFVNLTYTLPELTRLEIARQLGQEALLRCLIVGNAVVVYGAVTDGSPHRVTLSMSKFLHKNVKLGNLVGASSSSVSKPEGNESVLEAAIGGNVTNTDNSGDGAQMVAAASMGEKIFHNIFELWKEVKDSLSLPLLTLMCEKSGLPPPPSLLRLPTELKIKVLDSLPPLALANVSCACSEFRFLASSEELWKQKYKEEFGADLERAPGGRGWKIAFARELGSRRRSEEVRREAERRFLAEVFTPGVMLRPPSFSHPFGDFFQGLGSEPSQYNLPRGLRICRTPSANHPGGFFGMGEGGPYGDQDGVPYPGVGYDRIVEQAWPPVNNSRTRPGFRRLDGEEAGSRGGLAHPRSLDGRGQFPGFGPFS